MATFREFLTRVLSSRIVVRRTGHGLKIGDVNNLQSTGNPHTSGRRYKWKTSKNFYAGYGYGMPAEQIQFNRQGIYVDYELMDSDAFISSALDIYSDECTTKNEHGDILTITTDNEELKKVLHNLFYDILNIEYNLWAWIRMACKYGDFFLYLQVEEEFGITNVIPIHPIFIERDEYSREDEGVTQFIYSGEGSSKMMKNIFESYEIAHFRMLTDSNFLPYGKSILEGARKEFKKLSLMEDSMLIHRIMRAPERRIIKVDVGGIAPEEVDGYIDDVANTIKKVPLIDEATGEYNLKFNVMNMMEDFYLPVRGGESGTNIETLPGLSNEGQIEDIEYVRNKMLSYLKIPNAYLGINTEGGEGKATLAAEDIRFARTIERIQKIIAGELYKMAVVHLAVQKFSKEDLVNFEITLTNPSLIYKRQQVDLMNEQVNLIGNILEKRLFSRKYIYEKIFGLSEVEWKADQERILEDLKEEFRKEQIATEGNDPKLSGVSRGTPHDLASMQMATSEGDHVKKLYGEEDGREDNPGRPEKEGSFERHKDPTMGRDPVGKKALDAAVGVESILRSMPQGKIDRRRFLREDIDTNSENLGILDDTNLISDLE